jgi:iron uptake system component EfeO
VTLPKKFWVVAGSATLCTLSACGGQDSTGGSAGPITVAASDTACEVSTTSGNAGNLTFEVTNKGTKVTEFYLYAAGDRIMGEVENIAPGLTRKLTVAVPDSGTYQATCKPGMTGDGIRVPFAVTGTAPKQADADSTLAVATTSYATYVAGQSDALKTETQKFADAVKSGNVEDAKARYAATRFYYERIEPVAEKFGDLDPAIDAREADLAQGQEFTGFHRLEKDLWVTGLRPDSGQVADRLVADVTELVEKSRTLRLTGLDLANGAKELLDEVATGKITGEEEAFSHTDLWDFQANVDGSRGAIQALRPVLQERDPQLVSTVDTQFAAVQQLLDRQRAGDGFRYYTELTQDQIRELASAVDALSEPLSRVSEVVAR